MRRKPAELAASLVVIIFLPVALFGLVASVNEYRDQGVGGAVDCNGPLTVMLLAAPSLVVYAAGAVYYAVLLRGVRRSLPAAVLLVSCAVMAYAAGGRARAAYSEKNRPEHQESCGEGW
jgi:hypothetical protein